MNELKVFENPAFGQVRTIEEDGKVLFCLTDVAKALGYGNTRDAINRHCKGVVKRDTPTPSGVQSMNFGPEGDVYRLITHSKLPAAEDFEKWVFDEVVPSIRKTGGYTNPKAVNAQQKPLTLASVNNTAKILGKAMDEAGMEPVQKVLAFQQLYRKAGIDLNLTFPADERLYFLEDMAKELGVVSNNGIPHKQAMGAIVRKLSLDAGEKHLVHFERNGHMDSTDKYSRSVLDKAKAWLEENQYPAVIPGETKNFNVRYAHKG